jgi:hypothetical protein
MAETVEGGVYRVGDEWQNANGEKVSAPKGGESENANDSEGYPYRDALAGAGFADWNAVSTASDEELDNVPGIGPASVREIRAWKPKA